jgi:hypothetical protein
MKLRSESVKSLLVVRKNSFRSAHETPGAPSLRFKQG